PPPAPSGERAVAPTVHERAELHRDLLADEDVKAVPRLDRRRAPGRQRLPRADDQVEEGVAGEPQLAHPAAGRGVARLDPELDDLRAQRADGPRLDQRRGQ